MTIFSKLQIRSKILEIISNVDSMTSDDDSHFDALLNQIKKLDDYKTSAEVILKEYPLLNDSERNFCSFVLKNISSLDYICEKITEYIASKTLSDDLKYKYVELLCFLNIRDRIKELPNYFEKPNEIIDLETKKLLERASFNPEAMLDFLDFISNVSSSDAYLLLDSLCADYNGDSLANIIYPVLYSDFDDELKLKVINVLIETKSPLAIKPFKYLLEVNNNKEILNAVKIGLKKLKLAGANEDKAKEYFSSMIQDYKPAEFYATSPDGSESQAFLMTMVNKKGQYLLLAVVINDIFGILSCFGFYNIPQNDIIKIITKFYKSEGDYKVTPEYTKFRLNKAEEAMINSKKPFPYEYICWSNMLFNIQPLDFELKDYSNKNCKIQILSKDAALSFLTDEYTLRWFLTPNENNTIKQLTDEFYNMDNPNIEYINNRAKQEIDNVFNAETTKLWEDKFYNLIYLLRINNLLKEADNFYTILKEEELFNLFKTVILQRSIFSYYVGIQETIKEMNKTANIFKKKNSNESKFDIKKIENLISILKINWIK